MFRKILDFISLKIIGPINFNRLVFLFEGKYYNLTSEDRDKCKDLMESARYIWLSRRKTHLTTYLISLADFALGIIQWIKRKQAFPKLNFSKYTHAFFNIDDDLLLEAIGKGVIESYFDDVFDCDWICAAKISGLHDHEWEAISIRMASNGLKQLGKKYDTIFNLDSDNELSCIELIRVMIVEAIGNDRYAETMMDFQSLIQKSGNLTPQMLRDSNSFEVILEIKR